MYTHSRVHSCSSIVILDIFNNSFRFFLVGPVVRLSLSGAYGTLRQAKRGFVVIIFIDLRFPRPAAPDSATSKTVPDSTRAAPQSEASPTAPGSVSAAAALKAAPRSGVEAFELVHFSLERRREWDRERQGEGDGEGGGGREEHGEGEGGREEHGERDEDRERDGE